MEKFFTYKALNEQKLLSIPSATLAWIGDAVFSLCAREFELQFNKGKPAKLHKIVTDWVNAGAQAENLEKIIPNLTQIELDVVRRAKNAPVTTKSKHYGIADYKKATAFEALIGYLYLADESARLNEILQMVFGEKE